MSKVPQTAITPTRSDDFPEWYQQVVRAADLAENSEVRGCMVIKPWGYGIWEAIQRQLDAYFKATGHKNAYFPLLIPVSYLEKEASHVEGFATECAVVTHHRLELKDGRMVPSGELAEPYVIRPTSETIIGAAFARWVRSYRDLPLLINQWANVMRWEMRPRLFLRTAEFLWQEGHTAHETLEEAMEETRRMHAVYEKFLREHLAIPAIAGEKTEGERFPGALNTFTVEAMVQDRKAVQAGTSHFLGRNFSAAAGIEFESREGKRELAWTTSWGVSTRMMGGLIMCHGDDTGLRVPPRLAATQVVVMVIKDGDGAGEAAARLVSELQAAGVRAKLDGRTDTSFGRRSIDWELKGVPVRVEVGPRDLANGEVTIVRRDLAEKRQVPIAEVGHRVEMLLELIQSDLLAEASERRDTNTFDVSTIEEAREAAQQGFARIPWATLGEEGEAKLAEDAITVRCLQSADGQVPASETESGVVAVVARAY